MDARLLDAPPQSQLSDLARSHEAVASAIWQWWQVVRTERDRLPWRAATDPWHVLVSEMMLVQTQASRVAPRYLEFLERFPDVESCASASVGDILRAWAGLGYNRRAVQLQRCARVVVEEHAGQFPNTLAELLELPGVGPYVARAVLSFAFNAPVGVVDTNVGRVLARSFAGKALSRPAAQRLADSLVEPNRGREWNLAVMDLGALVCRSRTPLCGQCPIAKADLCAWRAAGDVDDPATGTATSSRPQSQFAGSDRQLRGRLIAAARAGEIPPTDIPAILGSVASERHERVIGGLVDDGLLVRRPGGTLALPSDT